MPRNTRALIADLRKSPHDVELLRAVQRALDDGLHAEELARLLEWWAGYAPDDPMASRALLDAARCLEGREDKRAHQLTLITQSLVRDPGNEAAAYRLRQVLEDSEQFDELERIINDWALSVRREGAPATLCALASFTLAHVRSQHMGDVDGAISALEDALRAFPEHPEAKRTLAELYAKRVRANLLSNERRAREDCHRAAQLYFELGNFELGEQAIAFLLRALDLVPHHSGAMEALIRRLGVKNLELLRRRLSGYVALSPDRVRTHRFRFELVRTLFRERRYGEAVPHLKHLSNRGYAEARRILERLAPEISESSERSVADLPPPPAYDEEHTKMETTRLSQADALRAPDLASAKDTTLVTDDVEFDDAGEHDGDGADAFFDEAITIDVRKMPGVLPVRRDLLTDEIVTVDLRINVPEEDKPTAVFADDVREMVLAAAPKAPSPVRPLSSFGFDRTIGLTVLGVTSAVAFTSYVIGLVQ
jgi:tetratricopeptide (TPR) repeat protein